MKILIIDSGIGAGHALDLANSGISVDYYIPQFSAFPKAEPQLLLSGIVNKPFYPGEDYSIIVIADTGYYTFSFPEYSHVIGYSPLLSKLELDRVIAKETFTELGIPVADYMVYDGTNLEQLIDFAEKYNEIVLKSNCRGYFETFTTDVDRLLEKLPYASEANPIMVEAKLNGKEIGFDIIISDSGMSDTLFYGYVSYAHATKAINLNSLPNWIRNYIEILGEFAYTAGYRGMFSAEFIVTESFEPYILEIAARFPYITSLIYTYNFGFYNLIKTFLDDYKLITSDNWLVGIPVFSKDVFGDVVLDEVDNYKINLGKYQLVLNQIYKIGDRFKIIEWPSPIVGVVYGSGNDLEVVLDDMTDYLKYHKYTYGIDIKSIVKAHNFFEPYLK